MSSKLNRYIVINPYQDISASYNLDLGSNALKYAEQNARKWYGKIVAEFTDGNRKTIRDFGNNSNQDNSQ